MTHEVCEFLWLRIILNDLKVACEKSIILFCYNTLVIPIAHNPIQHDSTKHIDIDQPVIKRKIG